MGNTLISYPDRTLAATLSGADFINLNNLKDPLISKVSRTTNVTGTKTINIDLGAERAIQLASLCGHNLTKDATIRVRGYSDSGHTNFVVGADTGEGNLLLQSQSPGISPWQISGTASVTGGNVLNVPAVNDYIVQQIPVELLPSGTTITYSATLSGSGTINFSTGNGDGDHTVTLSGTPTRYSFTMVATGAFSVYIIRRSGNTATSVTIADTQVEIGNVATAYMTSTATYGYRAPLAWPSTFTAQNVTDYPKNWTYCFSSPKTARYWKIEITDSTNSAGYIELGRCWLGDAAFNPALGIEYGLSLGYESRDIITESLGGIPWGEKRTPRRSLVATFGTMTVAEKRQAMIMQKVLSETTEAFFVTDINAAAEDMLLEAFPCFLSKPSPIQYPYYGNNVFPIQVIERV